jgi:uncharacterized SAM-binding protein YcdF (DUF218 family)
MARASQAGFLRGTARRPFVHAFAVVCASLALSTLAARWLIVREPLAGADALVVMAAGTSTYTDRLFHAVELFRSGKGARVLLTDDGQRGYWSRELQRNPTSVERAARVIEHAGVPRDRIEVLPGIMNGTIDEARAVKRHATTHGLRSLLVVTSPYHSRRAVWTFRHVLRSDGVVVGSDPVPMTPTTPRPASWWVRRSGWRSVGAEFVKLPYYWLVYGLFAVEEPALSTPKSPDETTKQSFALEEVQLYLCSYHLIQAGLGQAGAGNLAEVAFGLLRGRAA